MGGAVAEKLIRGKVEVVADVKKLSHGRKRFAGADALNIILVLAEFKAHLVFWNVSSDAEFCDALPKKLSVFHTVHLNKRIPGLELECSRIKTFISHKMTLILQI